MKEFTIQPDSKHYRTQERDVQKEKHDQLKLAKKEHEIQLFEKRMNAFRESELLKFVERMKVQSEFLKFEERMKVHRQSEFVKFSANTEWLADWDALTRAYQLPVHTPLPFTPPTPTPFHTSNPTPNHTPNHNPNNTSRFMKYSPNFAQRGLNRANAIPKALKKPRDSDATIDTDSSDSSGGGE